MSIFCTNLSPAVLILRRNERDMNENVYWSSCKLSTFLLDFKETRIFSTAFSKNAQISNFMKIRVVGAELFHADEETRRS